MSLLREFISLLLSCVHICNPPSSLCWTGGWVQQPSSIGGLVRLWGFTLQQKHVQQQRSRWGGGTTLSVSTFMCQRKPDLITWASSGLFLFNHAYRGHDPTPQTLQGQGSDKAQRCSSSWIQIVVYLLYKSLRLEFQPVQPVKLQHESLNSKLLWAVLRFTNHSRTSPTDTPTACMHLQSNNVQRHHKSETNQGLGNVHEEPFISSLSALTHDQGRVSQPPVWAPLGRENSRSQPQTCHLA